MQVFKVYFKIIRANMNQISIYLSVFITVTIIFSITGATKDKESFYQTKTKAAFINLDRDTELTKGLKEHLSKYANFIEIESQEEKLQDALFFREIDYIITIPENFTEDFFQGKIAEVEKTIVPNSTTAAYMDMSINKYLNTARIYLENVPGITKEELVENVSKDSSVEVQVNLKSFGAKKEDSSIAVAFFNNLAYSLLAMLILGVSSNLMVFNSKNLKRRNLCSPVRDRSFNMQLIAANMVFALLCYGFMMVFALIIHWEKIISFNGLMLVSNALIFTVAALSISYLVGIMIKSRNVQSAIANILSLGLCFLSGVFVPQEFLSSKVIVFASFNPTYWYVKANNAIGSVANFSFENISTIFIYMLIQLGFAVAIFSIALVVSKQRRIANS
jgi:ABC-2 type transport system permease protein